MGTSAVIRESQQGATPGGALVPQLSQLVGVLPERYARAAKQSFLVNFDSLNQAAGTVKQVTYRVDPNFHFVAIMAYGKIRDVTNLINKDGNPVLVGITDETGKSYIPNNGALDFENFYGSAKQPSVLAVPLIIEGPTGITFTFNNLHNADVLNIRTCLSGFLVAKSALARRAR